MNPVQSCIVCFHLDGMFGRAILSLWMWWKFRNQQDVTAGAFFSYPCCQWPNDHCTKGSPSCSCPCGHARCCDVCDDVKERECWRPDYDLRWVTNRGWASAFLFYNVDTRPFLLVLVLGWPARWHMITYFECLPLVLAQSSPSHVRPSPCLPTTCLALSWTLVAQK